MKGLFNSIFRSSSDFGFYKEIYNQPFGRTLKYLLGLTVLVMFFFGVYYSIFLDKVSKEAVNWFGQRMRYIDITDGVVSTDIAQPFKEEHKNFAVIIDTTGAVSDIDQKFNSGLLIAKDKVIFKQNRFRKQEISLAGIKKFHIEKEGLKKWRAKAAAGLVILIVLFQFVYFFIAKAIQAFAAALIFSIGNTRVPFVYIFNTCLYAVTPATVLSLFALVFFGGPLMFFPVIYFGMYAAFIIGGIRQIPADAANHN